jgi:hypothetical protein
MGLRVLMCVFIYNFIYLFNYEARNTDSTASNDRIGMSNISERLQREVVVAQMNLCGGLKKPIK